MSIHPVMWLVMNALEHLPYEVLTEAVQTELGEMVEMFIKTAHEDATKQDTMDYLLSGLSMYSIVLTVAARGGIREESDLALVTESCINMHRSVFNEAAKVGSLSLGTAIVKAAAEGTGLGDLIDRTIHTIMSAYEVPQVHELYEKLTKAE